MAPSWARSLFSARPAEPATEASASGGKKETTEGQHKNGADKKRSDKKGVEWSRKTPSERLAQYIAQYEHEGEKVAELSKDAKEREEQSREMFHLHHQFAMSVALIQVAIALSAVAALTRMKWVWGIGLAAGAVGVVFFVLGFLH